jgi:hypothetical protein
LYCVSLVQPPSKHLHQPWPLYLFLHPRPHPQRLLRLQRRSLHILYLIPMHYRPPTRSKLHLNRYPLLRTLIPPQRHLHTIQTQHTLQGLLQPVQEQRQPVQ